MDLNSTRSSPIPPRPAPTGKTKLECLGRHAEIVKLSRKAKIKEKKGKECNAQSGLDPRFLKKSGYAGQRATAAKL